MNKLTYVIVFGLILLSKMSIAALTPIVISASTTPDVSPTVFVEWNSIQQPDDNNIIPCAGGTFCKYGIMMYHSTKIGIDNRVSAIFGYGAPDISRMISVPRNMTWSQAAKAFIEAHGASGASIWYRWAWRPQFWELCIGAGMVSPQRKPPFLSSNNTCQTIPPSPTACNVDGRADIVHGLISSDKINGHKASTLLYMNCTAPAEVKLRILPEKIDLGGGVTSQVTVNGVGNGGIISSTGNTTLTVQSQLSSTGASPGAHVGSGVILFDVQ